MQSLTVNIFTTNLPGTVEFYSQLGFQQVASVPETPPYQWVMMMQGEVTVMFQTLESLGQELPEISRSQGGSLLLYIKLTQIRAFFEKLKSAGIPILKGLETTFYGATEFSILDPNGYVLTFAEDEANMAGE